MISYQVGDISFTITTDRLPNPERYNRDLILSSQLRMIGENLWESTGEMFRSQSAGERGITVYFDSIGNVKNKRDRNIGDYKARIVFHRWMLIDGIGIDANRKGVIGYGFRQSDIYKYKAKKFRILRWENDPRSEVVAQLNRLTRYLNLKIYSIVYENVQANIGRLKKYDGLASLPEESSGIELFTDEHGRLQDDGPGKKVTISLHKAAKYKVSFFKKMFNCLFVIPFKNSNVKAVARVKSNYIEPFERNFRDAVIMDMVLYTSFGMKKEALNRIGHFT